MKSKEKTKEQLQNELMGLHKKIGELEQVKASQKQTEEKLTKSEELYRLIAENTSDVITLHKFNLKATFTYISPSIKDFFSGYDPDELLGKSPFDFIHPDDKKKLFPILKDYINTKVKKLFTGKESPTSGRIEFRFKDKEGNWRYIQSTGNIAGNNLLFISRDITNRKKAEEAIRESQHELASLFKNIPQAVVYLDENSNIRNINPRFSELFGYTLEEIKGKNINEGMIHPPGKIEEGKNLDKTALSEGYFNYESIRKKKDGALFPVSISGSNIIIDRQLKGIIGTYFDITERKKMEQKLEKLAHYDVLTGSYSRGYGLNLLEQQIKIAKRKKAPILLLYLDVDDFKYINDVFGHQEGDKVLKEAVKLFKSTLREVDSICRIGGDEFLIIFPDSSSKDVPLIKKRINKNLKKSNQKLAKTYKIDFSISISCYDPSNPLSIDELIKIADEDMYGKKKNKKEDFKRVL